jgi:nonsense-mediated mRNA decay protein 3
MRCALCGKEIEKGSICTKCYVERNENGIARTALGRVTRCPKCGLFKLAGKWREKRFEDALMDAISLNIHPDFKVSKVKLLQKNGRYVLHLSGLMWDEEVSIEKSIEARVESETCLRCSREAGGYYESIVQVRADREIDKEERNLIKLIVEEILGKERENMKAFVSKIVEGKGIDYYIGDRNIGRKISRKIAAKLGGKIKESRKISGRSDGKEKFRFTYLIKLPAYRKGDMVEDDGKIAVVTNQKIGKGMIIDGRTIKFKSPRVIVRKSEMKKSVVLNVDEFAVEVLHPTTQTVVTAKKPSKLKLKPGDEVFLTEYEGIFYVIPKD